MKQAIKHVYLNAELPSDGNRFAQIVICDADIEAVGFEVIHDKDLGMTYEARVTYQKAGEFKRKTTNHAKHVYVKGDRLHVTQQWSRMKTASGAARFHLMGDKLTCVQLEGDEVQEMHDRINACACYDDRKPAMLAYARELTNGQV